MILGLRLDSPIKLAPKPVASYNVILHSPGGRERSIRRAIVCIQLWTTETFSGVERKHIPFTSFIGKRAGTDKPDKGINSPTYIVSGKLKTSAKETSISLALFAVGLNFV